MTYTELITGTTHRFHHSSLMRGYVSRKLNPDNYPCMEYEGKFGKGYKVLIPNRNSTQYCIVAYYVEQ